MKYLLIGILALGSFSTFASTCGDLQLVESKIQSLAFNGGLKGDERQLCFFLSRAVHSSAGKRLGLDGLTMGSIEFCVNPKTEIHAQSLINEIRDAIKAVPECSGQIGR